MQQIVFQSLSILALYIICDLQYFINIIAIAC